MTAVSRFLLCNSQLCMSSASFCSVSRTLYSLRRGGQLICVKLRCIAASCCDGSCDGDARPRARANDSTGAKGARRRARARNEAELVILFRRGFRLVGRGTMESSAQDMGWREAIARGAGETGQTLGARGSLEVGVALFSMFFGAGNLIIAPLLGVQAGPNAVVATLGYLVSGVGLPIAAIVAIARAGTAGALLDRIGTRFSRVFAILTYLAIGPCSPSREPPSTSFEMVRPLLPSGGDAGAFRLLFSLAFFAAALAFALHPARIVRLMGKVTGPLLIALLVLMVAAQVVARRRPAPSGAGRLRRDASGGGLPPGLPDARPSRIARLWRGHHQQYPWPRGHQARCGRPPGRAVGRRRQARSWRLCTAPSATWARGWAP